MRVIFRDPHDGTHSHPWATVPMSAIATGLMGIKPLSPGWTNWTIKISPGNLTTASIVLPTPKGNIEANYTRMDKTAKLVMQLEVI